MYVKETEIFKFKAKDNVILYNSALGNESKNFANDEQSEISLDGAVYDFSVNNSSNKKADILIINQYLMVKNNIK